MAGEVETIGGTKTVTHATEGGSFAATRREASWLLRDNATGHEFAVPLDLFPNAYREVTSETVGEKFKRLQEEACATIEACGYQSSTAREFVLRLVTPDPAFADYVIGLEQRCAALESTLAAREAEIERLEKTIDEWISHEETSRREYSEKLDIAIDLRTKLAAANQRIGELERALSANAEAFVPDYRGMDPARSAAIGPLARQSDWATKEDHYRFGWNAARAEMLRRIRQVETPTAEAKGSE